MLDPNDWEIATPDPATPLLAVIVDTEEEFDWAKPHDRSSTATTAMKRQQRAHRIFERHGVRPTYVIDYPVAHNEDGYRPLLELYQDGLCEVGAHLHPWVNPPHDEVVRARNSYPGNLPPALERDKLRRLTDLIGERFGHRPTVYKAGRYGVGPATAGILDELGYEIDASVVPVTEFTADGGPDFTACPDRPYWFGGGRRLLEIPLSVAFTGRLAHAGNTIYAPACSAAGQRLRLPGVLSRLGLIERIRLSPEGINHAEHRRLTRTMLERGHRVFSFTYHSPSLEPGHTPYVRDQGALEDFLDRFERYFEFFFDEIGGRPATPAEIKAEFRPAPEPDALTDVRASAPA
jgi:hypothetical protein